MVVLNARTEVQHNDAESVAEDECHVPTPCSGVYRVYMAYMGCLWGVKRRVRCMYGVYMYNGCSIEVHMRQ